MGSLYLQLLFGDGELPETRRLLGVKRYTFPWAGDNPE